MNCIKLSANAIKDICDTDSNYKLVILSGALEQIFTNKASKINFQMIYSKCYEICQNGMANELHAQLCRLVDGLVNMISDKLLSFQHDSDSDSDSDSFLMLLVENYTLFKSNARTVSDALLYLERVRQRFKFANFSIYDTCMEKYLSSLLLNEVIGSKVVALVARELSFIRQGKERSGKYIEKLIEMFIIMDSNSKSNSKSKSGFDYDNCNYIEEEEEINKDKDEEEEDKSLYKKILIPLLESETEKFYSNFLQENYNYNSNSNSNSNQCEEDNDDDDYNYNFYNNNNNYSLTSSNNNNNNNIQVCNKFLPQVSSILLNEEKLFSILPQEDRDKILSITIENLLVKNITFIFNFGVKHFFYTSDYKGLSSIYDLFFYKCKSKSESESQAEPRQKSPHLNPKKQFHSHLLDFFSSILKDKENNFVKKNNFNKIEYFNFYHYIEEINEIKKKFTDVLITAFESDTQIEHMIKSSLEKLVNKHEDFLDNFVKLLHEEIKISIKNRSDKVREFNEKFLNIFKLINDKDLFELEYRKLLAKRMLRNSSLIKETEFNFYSIMKKESGVNYVKKIENIINDIFQAQDLNLEFRVGNCKQEGGEIISSKKVDFYVKVISSENWPLEGINIKKNNSITEELQNIQCGGMIPNVLDNYIQDFTNFYYNKFKNRQIMWVHDLSWADVSGVLASTGNKGNKNDNKRRYSFIVTSLQMTLMMLYNARKSYSLSEILNALNTKENESEFIIDDITPLVNSGLFTFTYKNTNTNTNTNSTNNSSHNCNKILLQNTPTIDFTNTILTLSDNFSCKDYRLYFNTFKRVKTAKKEETKLNEVKEISHFILEDRKHQIDAAIMRVLKINKKLHYDSLKSQILELVSSYFVPEISTIKTRVDSLLDRNFIGRDANDPNIFVYMI